MTSWGGTHARRRSDTPAGFGSSLPTERAAAAQTFQPPRAKPASSCSSCATELAEPRPPAHESGARRHTSGARRHTSAAPQQRRRRRRRLEREAEEADPDSLVLPAEDAMELCTWLTEADPAHIRTVLTYYRWDVRRAVVGLLCGRYEQDLAAAQPPTPAATDDTAEDSPSKLSSTVSVGGEPPEGRRVALPARAAGRTLSSRPVGLETSIVGGQHTRRWAVPFAHECEALFERFRLQPHSLRVAAAIKPPQFTDESVQLRRKSETPRWNASTRRPRTAWGNSPKPEAEPQAKSRRRVDDGNAGTRTTSRDAGACLGLAEVEALAASIWQDPPPPRGVIALALTAQDSVGDGWIRSPSALRLLLRYAAFFASHWEDKFAAVLRSAGPPQGEEGHRLLPKKDWVKGFVALVGTEGKIGEEAAATEAHAEALAAFTARQQRGRSGVPWAEWCTWVAEKRVADAFVFGDTPRNSCYPAFTAWHRQICEPARELKQFLLWLGPLVPKPKPLKPWEFALADRHGHSGMIDQVDKWSARLEGRAVRAAEVRKDLACWAEDVLDEEARSMTPAARRRRKQQALDLARTRSQMTPQELAYAEGVAATKTVMAHLFKRKSTTRKVLEQLARAPVGQPGGERSLSLKVFIAALRQIGVNAETASDASLKRVFGSFDIDGNGTVTPSEFMTALREAEVVAEADKAAEEEEARLEQQAEREAREAAERAAERRRRDEEAAEAQRLRLAREAEVAAKAAAKAARARATPGAPPATSEATAGAAKSPAPLTVRNLLAGRVQ